MITVNGSKIIIAETQTSKGIVPAQEIDMTSYQGRIVRIYLDDSLNVVINPMQDCWWQIAEFTVPYQTRDEETEEILPLDLSETTITEYSL